MGNLTDDLTRLRRHIDDSRESRLAQQNARVSTVSAQIAEFASFRISNGLRDAQARAGFVSDNANDVKRLINNFRHTREVTGQQDRLSRAAFVNDTSKKTSDLLVGFNTDRKNQAAQSAKDRADFITSLTNSVAAFINEAANDRATAHAVFFGGVAPKKKNNIPSIVNRFVDEAPAESFDSSLIQPLQHRAEPFGFATGEESSVPGNPDAEAFDSIRADDTSEVTESKKSKKKFK